MKVEGNLKEMSLENLLFCFKKNKKLNIIEKKNKCNNNDFIYGISKL
ncbi:hypothetical protein BHW_0900053 (plasmid) [Borrelia hermsii MTW]|uniref:Uncharacterized protein n=1 Tax=Borrelia hermsii MTW TaxID=1313291 RepID=W5T685_BORHE|nr:hypothetical protein BHW_0900053 [Borrelia hermsii MTW]